MRLDFSAVASIAACVGVMVAVVGLIIGRRRARFSLGVSVLMALDNQWNNERFTGLRRAAATKYLRKAEGSEVSDIIDFFATVGLLLRKGVLNREMAWATFFIPLNYYWLAAQDVIARERRNDLTVWRSACYLHERLSAEEVRQRSCSKEQTVPSEQDLRDFLDGEAAMSGSDGGAGSTPA
jgi:hypothetical protein